MGLVAAVICVALAVVSGGLAAAVGGLVRLGPATAEDVSTVAMLLLILGILSIVISASAHLLVFRSRRLTECLLAEESDVPAAPLT